MEVYSVSELTGLGLAKLGVLGPLELLVPVSRVLMH